MAFLKELEAFYPNECQSRNNNKHEYLVFKQKHDDPLKSNNNSTHQIKRLLSRSFHCGAGCHRRLSDNHVK